MQPVVFSAAWFVRHQRTLLRLLAWPLVGRWFRWLLCIRPHDVGYAGRIVALHGHAYTVRNLDGTLTSDFRTHRKYAKRLYYSLLPVWRLCHAWDRVVANPLVPAWNLGFDTLTAYPDPDPETTSVDGQLRAQAHDEAWATLRGEAGDQAQPALTEDWVFLTTATATSNQWSTLYRAIYLFDTSGMTANGAASAATLSLYGSFKSDGLSVTPDLDIYTSTPATNTALVAGDFSQIGTTSQTGAPIAYASWSTTGYNDFALNATGLASIAPAGVSKFALRNASYDVANVAPTWSSGNSSGMSAYYADQTGTANDPKLVVTYTLQGRNRVAFGSNQTSAVANFANAASTTLAYPGAVTSNSLLTLCMTLGSTSGSISTVTDSVNSSGRWKQAVLQRSHVAGSSVGCEIWYAPGSSAGTPTVTVTMTSTMAGRFLFGIQAWTNASTYASDVLGNTVSTAGASSNLTTPSMGVSSGSVAIAVWKTVTGQTNRSNPSGWSTISPQNSTRENSFYQLFTSTDTVSTKWQVTASTRYVVAVAEFKGSTFTIVPGTSWTRPTLPLVGVQ